LYLNHFLKSLRSNGNRGIVSNFTTSSLSRSNSPILASNNETVQTEEFRPYKRPRTITDGFVTKKSATVSNNSHVENMIIQPRVRYESEDTNKWRDVCSNARTFLDDRLPTLEEAARMFGYVKKNSVKMTA